MRFLLSRYSVNRFYLFDDIFIVDKKRVHAFCDRLEATLLQEYQFDWHCLARADILDDELYKHMYRAGCRQITFGIESGSNRILKFIEKEATREENAYAIQLAKAAKIRVRAQMIVGHPGETDESVEETASFMRESPADSWGVHILVPLPGSQIYDDPQKFSFEFNKETTFEHYRTIGKPGEVSAAYIHKNPDQIIAWHNYLREVAGSRNVHQFDARYKAIPVE